MKIVQEIKDRVSLGEIFNVVIVDKDNDCSINMGFGFIPKSVLFESLDEFGCVMKDDMLSINRAINVVKSHNDKNFYEIRIEEIDQTSSISSEIYA